MKLLARIIEKLLGQRYNEDAPELDMYLPNRLLAIAGVFFALGIVAAAVGFMGGELMYLGFGVLLIPLGIGAFLCWKNQSIRIITSTTFEYTTFLGNTYTYRFSDITGLKKSSDSLTLLVGGKKVHIESMAILSDRLVNAIKAALPSNTETQA